MRYALLTAVDLPVRRDFMGTVLYGNRIEGTVDRPCIVNGEWLRGIISERKWFALLDAGLLVPIAPWDQSEAVER